MLTVNTHAPSGVWAFRGCNLYLVSMFYLVVVLEDLTIGQLADQFVTSDREEAMAWAENPTAIVEVLLED